MFGDVVEIKRIPSTIEFSSRFLGILPFDAEIDGLLGALLHSLVIKSLGRRPGWLVVGPERQRAAVDDHDHTGRTVTSPKISTAGNSGMIVDCSWAP